MSANSPSEENQSEILSIEKVLDTFHQSAAQADASSYLQLLSDDAIFLGTDGAERWNKQEFSEFVRPYFSAGKGWLYTPLSRNITITTSKASAFFDEALVNKNYGRCRGTGVLVKTPHGWKIAQYSLSVPMPNEIAKDLVRSIKQFEEVKDDK